MFKNILILAVLIAFVALILILGNVYHNITTSTVSSDITIQTVPITPSFDTNTLELLKKRKKVSVDLTEPIPTSISTPSPEEELKNQENVLEKNKEATSSSGL